jgi:hypothetical protein
MLSFSQWLSESNDSIITLKFPIKVVKVNIWNTYDNDETWSREETSKQPSNKSFLEYMYGDELHDEFIDKSNDNDITSEFVKSIDLELKKDGYLYVEFNLGQKPGNEKAIDELKNFNKYFQNYTVDMNETDLDGYNQLDSIVISLGKPTKV